MDTSAYLVGIFVKSPNAMVTLLNRNRTHAGLPGAKTTVSRYRHVNSVIWEMQKHKKTILRKALTMKKMDTGMSTYESVNLLEFLLIPVVILSSENYKKSLLS